MPRRCNWFVVSWCCITGEFKLEIEAGEFTDSEIIVMLGENGTGKTTFIRMLAGRLEPDGGSECFLLVDKTMMDYCTCLLMHHSIQLCSVLHRTYSG